MDLTRHEHVIWDWNGTLLEDVWLVVEVLNGMLRPRGLDLLDPGRYRHLFGFPVRDFYAALGFDSLRDPFERVALEFIEAYEQRRFECRLRAGAREALDCVAGAGVRQHLLSATQRDSLLAFVSHFGLEGRFEHMLGLGDHYAASKLEVARRWMTEAAIDPATALIIGDTTHDAEVAEALGVDCLLVEHGHQSRARLTATGLPVIASPEALRAVLCP